jgi:hypothetical protein
MKRLRGALVALNVLLILGVLTIAWRTFFVRHEAKLPSLDVKTLALVPQPRADADGYSVIWTQLDKPPPEPPPVAKAPPSVPPLEGTLACLAVDGRDCIALVKGEQLYLALGQTAGDYTCTKLAQDDAGWFAEILSRSGASGKVRMPKEDGAR